MKTVLSLLLPLLLLAGCGKEVSKAPSPHWIEGRWIMRPDSTKAIIEDWKKVDNTTWKAEVYEIINSDSTHTETITIKMAGDSLILIADAIQNPAPVTFNLHKSGENSIEFSNPLHDFPQHISYRLDSIGHLRARIGKDTNFIDFDYQPHHQ